MFYFRKMLFFYTKTFSVYSPFGRKEILRLINLYSLSGDWKQPRRFECKGGDQHGEAEENVSHDKRANIIRSCKMHCFLWLTESDLPVTSSPGCDNYVMRSRTSGFAVTDE